MESKATVDGTKSTSPTSAPDEDESTMTRISECSDDSNLIKLDLSQLVGEPNTNSEDTKEVEIAKSDVKEEEETTQGKWTLRIKFISSKYKTNHHVIINYFYNTFNNYR